jgi:hypothetical protein
MDRVAAENGIEIEFARSKKSFRKEERVKELLEKRGEVTGAEFRSIRIASKKVIKPLLAANRQTKPGPKAKNPTAIDQHYNRIQAAMRDLFQALGIAA